jgi:hypothetical protein
MILVLGVWTYLRALVGRATAVTLENVALRHQLAILQRTAVPVKNPIRPAVTKFARCGMLAVRFGPEPLIPHDREP